ncbi:HAD-IIB family hydrolase [Spiroplasma citri]|uniref:HAD-IIB family hydrolase n=1 Tax=Spiroplasma citri TaxID=2133 RepID=UPI001EF94B6A|nr:HAD-IIB family hydrolase [Spiroplasma citri]
MNLVKKYPYIITDLDGTIAGKGYLINPETYEALQTYQLASNYHLFLASGRLDLMAKEYFAKLKIKTPIISCNGALIRDSLTNEILYQQPLPQALALAVLTNAIEGNVDHIVYTANMVYGHPGSSRIAFMLKYNAQLDNDNYLIPIDTETDYVSLLKNNEIEVLKILFPFNSSAELEQVQAIYQPFKNEVDGVFSQKDLFDIQALNINKGNAFKKLCVLKEYDPQQFIFYGDNYNDLELAKIVGYTVAMGNSVLEWHHVIEVQQINSERSWFFIVYYVNSSSKICLLLIWW